ncbi:uncharacterized protein L3040_004952 [Drepanopeziza brunnea f. sp. 'multigermtubi']|uniref:uncharacterized protein n=1 Tax=Drepanopeziza brunnea f. sp. 'multigermtubi' TaxID=698441 RepID=UPI00239817E7|nr:hypothetical protein L3040_004952 [Drepanopeziza brunnea f. sp. 'multigermtubi']
MSRPFNGDLSDLIARGWKSYKMLSQAPEQLRPLCEAVAFFVDILRMAHDAIQENVNQLSASDRWLINSQKEAISMAFDQLETAFAGLRSGQQGIATIATMEGKFMAQSNQLSSFLELLQGYSREKISTALASIPGIESVASDWDALQVELERVGISKELARGNFFLIDQYLKENVSSVNRVVEVHELGVEIGGVVAPVHIDEDDPPPDYTPGSKQGTNEEKGQSLERTNMVVNHSDPEAAMATSSKSPPAYEFEEGQDETLDQDYAKYVKEAIENEAGGFAGSSRSPSHRSGTLAGPLIAAESSNSQGGSVSSNQI